ncbi:two-component sensor histidine kinase [Actinomyces sp. HMSC075C01]|uniref:histidine kinase n=1 Tax=Actinomyces oris TaxID=544580 RepID=A0A1Q8VZT2_9ACTO|nr:MULTISPECIES: histidine kinase [Actinomyces]OFR57826.1 two-component sensor histidine kinase [Actinomyces sp. HMSC075C01]OLO54030.1 two-component sensor histidine kinase [Actinomyces oris]
MPAPDVPPRHSPLGRAITGLTVIVLGLGTLVGYSPDPSQRAQMTVLLVMAGLVAASLWLRRRDQRAYERRLAQETAARAVAEDRLVIARELHDAVSGNLGAITVRCAVARRLETTPDGLRTALDDVETASREATDALRRMLAVLRDESRPPTPGVVAAVSTGAPGGAPVPEPVPVNSLAESFRELIGKARRTGVTVDLDADVYTGTDADVAQAAAMADGLPAPTAQAAARVVAEALANTARHAGPTCARVTLRREPERLRIVVVDDGPATGWEPHPGAGQGLRGLHERLTTLGGALTAGPRADAPGFAIEAILPIAADDAARPTGSTRCSRDSAGPERRPANEPADTDPRSDRGNP